MFIAALVLSTIIVLCMFIVWHMRDTIRGAFQMASALRALAAGRLRTWSRATGSDAKASMTTSGGVQLGKPLLQDLVVRSSDADYDNEL